MKRRKILALLLVLSVFSLTILAAGCGNQEQSAEKTMPKEINITFVKSPLNVPSIVAKNNQLFEKEFDGIEVNFPEITAGSKQSEALAAGALDFCNPIGGTSAILAAANGVDLKIISIYSRAPKAFRIVTKSPDIQTIADLKGKKIAGPKGTVLHQLLATALAKNNLKYEDVEHVAMDQPAAVSALMNGSVDAVLVAAGEANRAVKAGGRVLTTGEDLVQGTIVVAVRGEFLEKYPELVQRFRDVQKQSLDFIKDNQEEALEMAAKELQVPLDEVKEMYAWYDFDPTIRESDIEDLDATQDFLVSSGMLEKTIEIEDLIVESN